MCKEEGDEEETRPDSGNEAKLPGHLQALDSFFYKKDHRRQQMKKMMGLVNPQLMYVVRAH